MTVALVYIVFLSFVTILIITSFYLINSLLMKEYYNKILKKETEKMKKTFNRHIENINNVSLNEYKILRKHMRTRKGLEAFTKCYKSYLDTYGYNDKIDEYVKNIVNFNIIFDNKIVSGKSKKTYVLYLLALYRINCAQSKKYALDSLEDESAYCRNNALNVIKNSKDVEDLIKTLEIINKSKFYFNEKLITEFIQEFQGDREDTICKLMENFDSYNDELISAIIQYFINTKEDRKEIQEKMMYILTMSDNPKLVKKATKYFGRINNKVAGEIIIHNLESDIWEVRATSAEVLRNYENIRVIQRLKEKLFDSNWFVRMNSAFSLVNMNINIKENRDILESKDKRAIEVFCYALYKKGYITIEEYINSQSNKEAV